MRSGPPPPTGQDYAKAVFAADMDGDGDPDIVFASEQQNQVGWYETRGHGVAFVEHIVAADMPHAKSVYAADIDRDGDMDILAAAAESGVVALYENDRGRPPTFVTHVVNISALGARQRLCRRHGQGRRYGHPVRCRDNNSVLLYPNLATHRTALFDPQAQFVVGTYRRSRAWRWAPT